MCHVGHAKVDLLVDQLPDTDFRYGFKILYIEICWGVLHPFEKMEELILHIPWAVQLSNWVLGNSFLIHGFCNECWFLLLFLLTRGREVGISGRGLERVCGWDPGAKLFLIDEIFAISVRVFVSKYPSGYKRSDIVRDPIFSVELNSVARAAYVLAATGFEHIFGVSPNF